MTQRAQFERQEPGHAQSPSEIPRTDIASLKLQAAGLSRVLAAIYVGVSPSKFDEMVADGRMPRPKRIDARKIWLRKQLDLALEALPVDGSDEGNPWDAMR